MDEPSKGTVRYTVSVCVTATVAGDFDSVNALERAIGETARQTGRELYAQAFAAVQRDWLARRRSCFSAQRWRRLQWLTPFGPVELPVRVVREKSSGRYFTLSKILFRSKATRLLSPALEQEACVAATQQNYRPAARSLSRWVGAHLGHWLVWACVQFHGARRLLQLAKTPVLPAQPMNTPVLVSEVDSTWLKAQRRRRAGPVQHFPVHLGLHYTGRTRRYQARGSASVRLHHKHLLVSVEPLATFGRSFQLQAHQLFRPAQHIVLSDGDEGLERLREKHFPQATWLLDRWHLIQAVRALTAQDQQEFARLMAPVWRADSEAALEALRTSPYQRRRPLEFHALFGYLLGNRHGIDAWKQIPASLRRTVGRCPAPVKAGSGAVEKNIEIHINRRFKRQGRSWHPLRAQRLLQLKNLYAQPSAWNHFWTSPPQFHFKPKPP